MSFVRSFDGTKVYYRVYRNKKPFIFFIHGLGGSSSAWSKEIKFFRKKRFSIILADLRGHGYSERPSKKEDYNIDNFAKDLKSILNKEKISKIVLVGHCFGGVVSLAFYNLFPKVVSLLVLINSNYGNPLPTIYGGIFRRYSPLLEYIVSFLAKHKKIRKVYFKHVDYYSWGRLKDFDIKRVYKDIMLTSFKSYLAASKEMLHFDGKKVLKKIDVPTLVLQSEKDKIVPIQIGRKMAKLIKKSSFEIIKNENHVVVINDPDSVNKAVFNFINVNKC